MRFERERRREVAKRGRWGGVLGVGEGGGPAAVGVDGFVELGHEGDGFVQGDVDAVVVGDVGGGERAALAVLEPLLADLVAADVEVPHVLGHAAEADGAGDLGTLRAFLRFDGGDPALGGLVS